MSNLLAPLALAMGLNTDPALYDRLQFEGLLKPGLTAVSSQLAQADIGYRTKNLEVSAHGSTTADRKFTGFGAEAKLPLEALDLILKYDFFNPSVGKSVFGGSFGVGKSYEAPLGPMNGEILVTGDTTNYVSGKISGSAQDLNNLLRLFLELSNKPGADRQRFVAEYFWKPSDASELGAGLGSSQRGLEWMVHAGYNPFSTVRVEVKALGNNQYQVATVGLSWNEKGLFDENSVKSNKYLRKQARLKESYRAEAKKMKKTHTAETEKLKKELGMRTKEDDQRLDELISDAQETWSNYSRLPEDEDDLIDVCNKWHDAYLLDPEKKELKRFITATSGKRYDLANKHYWLGIDLYKKDKIDNAIEEFKTVLRILTGSLDGDAVLVSKDPDNLVFNCLDYVQKGTVRQLRAKELAIRAKELATPKPQPPVIATPNALPTPASSTAKPKQ